MSLWSLFGVLVIAGLVLSAVGWLVNWARRAIKAAFAGISRGVLVLRRLYGEIRALAFGHGLAGEIPVDEADLPAEVQEELRRRGYIKEDIDVE
jgi:hypothetical protein